MPGSDLDVDVGVYCAVHSSSSGRGIVRGFLVEQGSNSHVIQIILSLLRRLNADPALGVRVPTIYSIERGKLRSETPEPEPASENHVIRVIT